jgi:class 3 adenylate cyclase/cold shock CspA family protein
MVGLGHDMIVTALACICEYKYGVTIDSLDIRHYSHECAENRLGREVPFSGGKMPSQIESESPFQRRPLNEILADPNSRRPATVVCYDQRGSTRAKLTKSEAEWVAQAVKVFDTILDIAQDERPGVAWSFVGDGLMLFYDGDDEATAATQTAIRVQERLAELNRPAANGALLGVIDVKVSVGASTGEPWWFETTPGHPNVIGTCADTAARLCGAATPQAILIDDETASVMNPRRLDSLYGKATGRTPGQYLGDKQHAALKGITDPVGYQEILWEQQRFGVRSEMATPPAGPSEPVVPVYPAPAAPAPAAELRAVGDTRPEKLTGKIKFFSLEKNFGFIISASGEQFFFARSLLSYPDDAGDLEADDEVAFMALPAVSKGKSRRAGAVLVIDDYAEAVLVVAPSDQRRHGWLEIKDDEDHRWLLYMPAPAGDMSFSKGQELEFKVVMGPRGPEATEVTVPTEGEAAA